MREDPLTRLEEHLADAVGHHGYLPWAREVDLQVPAEHVSEMDQFFASHLAAS